MYWRSRSALAALLGICLLLGLQVRPVLPVLLICEGGYIIPGYPVDIIVVRCPPGAEFPTCTCLLRRVQVLTVDYSASRTNPCGVYARLDVSPAEYESLRLAMRRGTLHPVLCPMSHDAP